MQFRRNTGTPSLESVFEISSLPSEGEASGFDLRFREVICGSMGSGSCVNGMVEGRSEITENISGNLLKLLRQFFNESNLENGPTSLLRVRLDKGF
jgi:hypothetical protein